MILTKNDINLATSCGFARGFWDARDRGRSVKPLFSKLYVHPRCMAADWRNKRRCSEPQYARTKL